MLSINPNNNKLIYLKIPFKFNSRPNIHSNTIYGSNTINSNSNNNNRKFLQIIIIIYKTNLKLLFNRIKIKKNQIISNLFISNNSNNKQCQLRQLQPQPIIIITINKIILQISMPLKVIYSKE